MKRLKKIALSAVAFLTAGAAFLIRALSVRAKKAEADANAQRETLAQVTERAGRLQKTADETANVEGKANEEKKSLAETPDSGLAGRANKLF